MTSLHLICGMGPRSTKVLAKPLCVVATTRKRALQTCNTFWQSTAIKMKFKFFKVQPQTSLILLVQI